MRELRDPITAIINKFPNQLLVLTTTMGKLQHFELTVDYTFIGNRFELMDVLELLKEEWGFIKFLIRAYQYDRIDFSVIYTIKDRDINEFIKKVNYRGEEISI